VTCRSISVATLLLVLIAWGGSAARAQEPPLKVLVLAGTSNLTGSGARIAELPDDLKQPQKDVLVYQGGAWVPLDPGKAPLRGNGKSNFGVEVTFGQAMTRHPGQPIGIITGSMRTTSPDGGYAQLVRTVNDAKKSRPIIIAGMSVQLFEASDAKIEEMATAFPTNLTRYIESARRDFGNAAMPFAKNRALPLQPNDKTLALPPNSLPQSGFPYLDVLRKAEASIDLPGFRLIDLDDLPKGRDVHYNTQGILELGKRHAAAMLELLKAE